MLNNAALFDRPPSSLGQVLCQVFEIFRAEWRTFMILSGLQFAAFIPFVAILMAAMIGMFYSETKMIFSIVTTLMGNQESYDPTRTRGLSDSHMNYHHYDDDDSVKNGGVTHSAFSLIGKTMLSSILFFWLAYTTIYLCITSTFQAATILAVADIYAGRAPCWWTCIKVGWKNICKILAFGFLLLLAYFIFFLILVVGCLALFYSVSGSSFPDHAFAALFVFVTCVTFANATMIAGPSSIVVERKSVNGAIKGSWHLCKSSVCLIYCSILCFLLFETVVRLLFRSLLARAFSGTDATTSILVLGVSSFIVSLVIVPMNMIIGTVLYFSLRMRKNGVTQADVIEDLALESCVELSSNTKYEQASTTDDDSFFEKHPITAAV